MRLVVKNCFAVGCSNACRKGSGVKVYRFVNDPDGKAKLSVRTGHQMSILGWLSSQHTQEKSNNVGNNFLATLDIAL